MRDRVHENFILSHSMLNIADVVDSSKCIGDGIETYPLCVYIMQSLFLRLTGEQEQKFKCLCWEIATTDYEFRYERFCRSKLGECSDYKEKSEIYKNIISLLKGYTSDFSIDKIDKNFILSDLRTRYYALLDKTNLSIWQASKYQTAKGIIDKIVVQHFMNDNNLLSNYGNLNLIDIYVNNLYRQRNRLAHNLTSFQENLPSLRTLASENNIYNNYFLFYFILLLIDSAIRELFALYLQITETYIV